MQPLNPFLAAFFKSPVIAQCSPVHHHIVLVPLTDVLLTSRDVESGILASEAVLSEEFLSSHVLRIPPPTLSTTGKDGIHTLREVRGKAKQFSTLNGRTVVIKDSIIYSNKGIAHIKASSPQDLVPTLAIRLISGANVRAQASKLYLKRNCSRMRSGIPMSSNRGNGYFTSYQSPWLEHGKRSGFRQRLSFEAFEMK